MIGYLFDTCIVRTWYAKNAAAEAYVNSLPPDSLVFISAISLGEIECGHLRATATDPAKQEDFRRWINKTFQIPQLPVTSATAIEYAKFRRAAFSKFTRKTKFTEEMEDSLGNKIGIDENDLWIVAQAAERNLTLITHDKMRRIRDVVQKDVPVVIVSAI